MNTAHVVETRSGWPATTHEWSADVDLDHLASIRAAGATSAPGGAGHLVLEVLAYADDEAAELGRTGACSVTLHDDGSVSVADDGRGTQTRYDEHGAPVRKPVMSTKDLRFFADPASPRLPDGRPRRGISVVAALSAWLVHENRRADGAWTQRYEHGVPVGGLVAIRATGTTGTTVHFLPYDDVVPVKVDAGTLRRLARFPHLTITLEEQR